MHKDEQPPEKKVVLVGNPNVGKSVIFRLLTGSYVLVSNFPGTTVEVTRGRLRLGGITYEIIDTPGVCSLVPQSEDERVTCEILLQEKPDVIVQVADAKNLRRTLLITSQLVEFKIPMILVLNMMDEAEERGITIDAAGLTKLFSIEIVETSAIYSRGKKQLLQAMQRASPPSNPLASRFGNGFQPDGGFERVPLGLATEWLSLDDPVLARQLEEFLGRAGISKVRKWREDYRALHHRSLSREIEEKRGEFIDESAARFKSKRESAILSDAGNKSSKFWLISLIGGLFLFAWNEFGGMFHLPTPVNLATSFCTTHLAAILAPLDSIAWIRWLPIVLLGVRSGDQYQFGLLQEVIHLLLTILPVILPLAALLTRNAGFARELGILTRKPSTGVPILLGVLMLVYEFVGYTGAQTLVGLLEKTVFGQLITPVVSNLLPSGFLREFMTGKYGMISMGLTYAVAIVLPVVATFFIAFGLLEDSGYLPRLSILMDRIMRLMGLNGKATLPMVLGLGCCTMATMTTRILNSRKERLIATLLLALGIPCSAQLGVILGIASAFSFTATLTIVGVVVSQLFLVGYLASKLVRGRPSEFIFEIPPIRVPQMRNVLLKTWYRIRWYMLEAVPLFLYGTLALYTLDALHLNGRSLLTWIETALAPILAGILRLPAQAAGVFVLGFLRRDYGAAGLFAMVQNGLLNAQQTVVSLIVLTLFVPCLASFLVIIKEQGLKRALGITAFIVPFAISVGGIVSWMLRTLHVTFR